jgi:hypothetical protein
MQTLTMPTNYSDRFDITKNYRRLFFLQGLGLQAAELNELQDTIRSDLSIMATYLIGQGKVVTGGTVLSLISTSLSMDAAGINVDGHIIQVPSAVVTILGTGLEYVGVAVINNLITPTQDPSIVEQAPTSPNLGQPGADREQYSGRWCTSAQLLTGESFFPIITLNNGVIVTISTSTDTSFNTLLNQYDNSVRGSALLNGMTVAYSSTDPTTGSIIMSVSSGNSRVLGVPVTIPYQQYCALAAANDTSSILSDFYTYVVPPSSFTMTPATTGGTLAAATYTYKVTSLTSSSESFASTAQTATTTGSTGQVTVAWTAVPGATSYNVYGRTSGDAWKLLSNVSASPFIDIGSISTVGVTIVAPTAFKSIAHYAPVENVIQLSGNVQTAVSLTKGVSYSTDVLPNPTGYASALSVISIVAVNQGGTWNGTSFVGGTTYSASTDYQLSGVYSIQWKSGGVQPLSGSTYSVVYIYNAVIYPSTGVTFLDSTQNYFLISPTNTFVNNTTLNVAYNYYLSRIDRVNIDQFGNFVVFKGTPGYLLSNVFPIAKSRDYLSLAQVLLQFNQSPVITTDTINNLMVSDIDTLQQQVLTLQTQVATLSLTNLTNSIAPTSIKRGIFVDSLVNTNYIDSGQINTAITFSDTSSTVGTYSLTIPSALNLLGMTPSWTTLPYTESVYASQTLCTGSRQINPYSTISTTTLTPSITLNPPIKYCNEIYWWFHGSFLPYSTIIQVNCMGFQPGETVNVNLGPSGTVYNTTTLSTLQAISIPTITANSGVANSSGNITIPITILFGQTCGIYLATATGATSGVYAQTTFTIASNVTQIDGDYSLADYWAWGGTNPIPYGFDPIAETYQFSDQVDFTSIVLNVTQLPAADLQVRAVGVSLGIPDTTTVYGNGKVAKNSVVLGNNRIPFSAPISNVPNKPYAMTILTATSVGAVGTAKMGLYNIANHSLVNSKPFSGVFQLSSNYQTWVPVEDEDLTFTLNRAVYNTTTASTIALVTTSSVTNYTDWLLSGAVSIPSGTTCSFYLQDASGNQYPITPNNPMFTLPISGIITLYAVLCSYSNNVSPIIPAGLELLGGTASQPATYTSVAIAIPNGTTTPGALTIVLDTYNPLNNGVTVKVQTGVSTFSTATFVSSTAIGNGWTEVTYSYSSLSALSTRLQLVLSTSNTSIRPKVTNIRVIVV